ncbi:hypothetical protein BY996DRAFT_4580312 [Phakopsora pachyrhizi]|uniref:Uncharacterized protein n=1 Tax=Phakopsora pachyrhizi TaxID=170000 RepID=A0AAV0BQ79_PHAPC|nr:hypothetical protein BY996DRAFT_4580312 [Phakopsora pachyrhizi]CAH7689511.1 hypothetical protein PPACK8108_LOCUS24598 [Phakopsora pachyrhizi]
MTIETSTKVITKRIVIIGAASGIGAHCALHFAKEHGARVALLDQDVMGLESLRKHLQNSHPELFQSISRPLRFPLEHIPGDKMLFMTSNYISEASLKSSIELIIRLWGGIDGLVNNQGFGPQSVLSSKPIELMSFEEFESILRYNLSAHWLASKVFIDPLSQTSGSIVNLTSIRATQSEPDWESFAICKSGIIGLTHSSASSFSSRCVRVNAISSGWIDIRDAKMDSVNRFPGANVPPLLPGDNSQHWSGRVGNGTDVAKLAWFLINRELSEFIDGQCYTIDGGVSKKMNYT